MQSPARGKRGASCISALSHPHWVPVTPAWSCHSQAGSFSLWQSGRQGQSLPLPCAPVPEVCTGAQAGVGLPAGAQGRPSGDCSPAGTALGAGTTGVFPRVARDLGPHARGAGPPTALAPDPRPSPFSVSPDLRLHPFQGLTPQMRVSRPESRTRGTRFGPHQGGRQRFSCSVSRGWAGFVRANTHLGL